MRDPDPVIQALLERERQRAEQDLENPDIEWGVPGKRLDDFDADPDGFLEWVRQQPRCERCQQRMALVDGLCGVCLAE